MTIDTPPPRRYVGAREIEALLDVDKKTLIRLVEEEGLPRVELTPRLHRYDLDAVYAWIDSRWNTRTADETAA
jgi:predicted DNA-binding transcriptional regulator AlpA